MSMSDIVKQAKRFAYNAHLGQYRKCNSVKTNLYVSHPLAVMDLVEKFGGTKEDMVVACLHDVIEDCEDKGYDYDLIKSTFGENIADRVMALTNQKVDPRTGEKLSEKEWKEKKAGIQLEEIKKMSPSNQLVKACDQIHNMSDYNEVESENIVYRESYIDKAYSLIMVCSNLPISLKVHARNLHSSAKDFFKEHQSSYFMTENKFLEGHKSATLHNYSSKLALSL